MPLLKFDYITSPPLLRKIQFWLIQTVKNVIFGNFVDSELWILVNFGLESCPNLLKTKFITYKIAKNDNFGPFESTKIWFHVKSERRLIDQISTKSSLNFTFWKFLEHSALRWFESSKILLLYSKHWILNTQTINVLLHKFST